MSGTEEGGAAAATASQSSASASEQSFGEKVRLLETAVSDADNGTITNARKMEALSALEDCIPSLSRAEAARQQGKVEELVERLLGQNATEPLRRLAVSVLNGLYHFGDMSALQTFVGRLLKLTGEQNKKVSTDTKVAALDAIGELMQRHGRTLEPFSTDIFVVVAKHMKFPEASARCSAFQCLCRTISVAGAKTPSIANNIWKMLQKMLQDKAVSVRTAAANALSALVVASPQCANANGEDMSRSCLKAMAADDTVGLASALSSECRFAFAVALAHVLAGMATPMPPIGGERPKKKPAITDFASAVDFLEQTAVKNSPNGQALVPFRAGICLASIRLAEAFGISDSPSITLVMRMLMSVLDAPSQGKSRGGSHPEDELLSQVAWYLTGALRRLLSLADSEACLLDFIEQGLVPQVSAQFNEASRTTDLRTVTVLECLASACIMAGDGFRSLESKVNVKKPLLHLVGNHPNPLVQLHAAYCLRVVAHSSPPQLFQLMSLILNLVTVQNAELLGTPMPKRGSAGSNSGSDAIQPLLRGLFGHCAALAALVGELFHSDLGVPHDVTSAVLGTSCALLQPHPSATVSAQRRSCAYLLLEGLMCLGTDWVATRLTKLFPLWKAALGKKPVDRAKVLYQQHAAQPPDGAPGDAGAGACRDELLSLLCALRSLYAFSLHSRETLLVSHPHLHRILVVFLSNISQLVVALPHPNSASLRAKYRSDGLVGQGQARPIITFSSHCSIPDILLMIRSTMYKTFAAMMPAQYSTRFVPLLNMLADDATRALPSDFPIAEFVSHFLHPDDGALDLVDPHSETSKESPTTIRLAVSRLLSEGPIGSAEASQPRSQQGAAPESLLEFFSHDAAASGFFSGPPHEGPGGTDGLLTPWDAWFDPQCPLVGQCTTAEWDWRCSVMSLLAIIMNSNDVAVTEQSRAAVLTHLLKKQREPAEDASDQKGKKSAPPTGHTSVVSNMAVLTYLREHIKVRGIQSAPPAGPVEQILQLSIDGLKDANPLLRRMHVEILSLLFYIHHQMPDSAVVPSILQHINAETSSSDSAPSRSAIALLCGAVLRVFAWGNKQVASGPDNSRTLHCPYLMNIVPSMLKLGRETAQPVRLWMLHSIHLAMRAAGAAFAPFLKDALRLGVAHILADFFESPLVLWEIAALVQSAAALPTATGTAGTNNREENVTRIVGIWSALKHVRYSGPSSASAFAIVRTEVLCIATAHCVVKLAPTALSQLKDVVELVSSKLAPRSAGGSPSSAVRAAAAQCLTDLVAQGISPSQAGDILQEPSRLLSLLEAARGQEAQALQDLIKALVRQRGLLHLPVWLQTLKEIILALPPKAVGASQQESNTPAQQTTNADGSVREEQDAHDDGAGLSGPSREEQGKYRAPHSVTKVFAVSCLQLLLEQVDPQDASHWQTEMPGSAVKEPGAPEQRLVHHLETLVALAAHASSAEEASLAEAGLRLMLLIVSRFRCTRDVQGRNEEEEENCPLLLVQYEAQVTTCIRHNVAADSRPDAVRLALELLRDVIAIRACNSSKRLVDALMQPFSLETFEPNANFCEYASTKTFIFRLCCACELLDGDVLEESAAATGGGLFRDLARWIEQALRDAAVLLAGLPQQSVKTYKPVCFSLADYKAVQHVFREALPKLLRGVHILCTKARAAEATLVFSPDLVSLTLGIVLLVMSDQHAYTSESDLRICVRTARQVLLYTSLAGNRGCAQGKSETPSGAEAVKQPTVVIDVAYFLDLMGAIWNFIFRVPSRCNALLPDILDLMYAVSGSIWGHREKRRVSQVAAPESDSAKDVMWLDGLCEDTESGRRSRGVVAAYALHAVAASLRCPAVLADADLVSHALEVFIWWLGEAWPASLLAANGDDMPEDEIMATALKEGSSMVDDANGHQGPEDAQRGDEPSQSCPRCFWLWLLFLSPFPLTLVQSQPVVTLKYWKKLCAVLCSEAALQSAGSVNNQLRYIALLIERLCKSLTCCLEEAVADPQKERELVPIFAMLVQRDAALASLCTVLQQTAGETPKLLDGSVRAVANRCLARTEEVFAAGLRHKSPKVVQTTISSMQNVLQNRTCLVLFPVIMPCLVSVLILEPETLPAGTIDSAWGAISGMLAGSQQAGSDADELMGATIQLVLRMVLCQNAPGAAAAQCLVQVARLDPKGLKAEVAALPAEGQRTVQQLMQKHLSTASGQTGGMAEASTGAAPTLAPKIELKLKF